MNALSGKNHEPRRTVSTVLVFLLIGIPLVMGLTALMGGRASANIDNPLTINGNPLRITVYDDSTFEVYRKEGSVYQYQYYRKQAKGSVIFLKGSDTSFRWGGGFRTFDLGSPDFTPVSHTQPDPWTIVTVYAAGSTGVKIAETVTYVNGRSYYQVKYDISNTGSATYSDVRFMNGCDAWFGGDDFSNGYWNAEQRMVYLRNAGVSGIMGFYGDRNRSPASYYMEGFYSTVRDRCSSGNHLTNTVDPDYIDSAYALEWDRPTLAPGQTWQIYTYEKWTTDADVQVFAPSDQTVDSGRSVILPFDVVNFESVADTFDLTVTSANGWQVAVTPQSITLAAGAGTTVNVTLEVPPGTDGNYDTVTLKAVSRSSPTIFNSDSTTVNVGSGPQDTAYLCEGSTDWGYDCYLTVQNPNSSEATIQITFQTKNGPMPGPQFKMPPLSQATVNPRNSIGNTDFSAEIHCAEGLPIAADRTMSWNRDAQGQEAHCSIGVANASTVWYLPEGSSSWGFECWLLIQNINDEMAYCGVTYMTEYDGPRFIEVMVPPNTRVTLNMADDLPDVEIKDASIKVASNIPVIAERAMYRNNRREGHASIGTTTPSNNFYLAEGCAGFGFTTFILIQNPGSAAADVDVTYMTGAGPVAVPTFQMPANSRKTINVNSTATLPDPNFSTMVHGSSPIIAERAMYWISGGAEICHDSVGMASPHDCFHLPDGESTNGRETWTLIQNPNSVPVDVDISYLTPTGAGNVTKRETVPANSRVTFNMLWHSGMSGRASILVNAVTPGMKVMAERAMYYDNRGAGTNTIGGCAD